MFPAMFVSTDTIIADDIADAETATLMKSISLSPLKIDHKFGSPSSPSPKLSQSLTTLLVVPFWNSDHEKKSPMLLLSHRSR
ncbi:unnamed protein product [Linum trigynum]|uniref:Uncharacterized protein n=1 Tax=Linum trigynum TaxID=586398 RepID=A0AAV2E0X5_9ROSI